MANLGNGAGCTVTAQQDADLFMGIFGDSRLILNVGRKMDAAIIDNNTIRIYDGMAVTQGRTLYIQANTYDEFKIETGTQNVTRYDIIGYRIYHESGKEKCELYVKKDVGAEEVVIEESLRDGADEAIISMYKVKIEGLTVTKLIPLYSKIVTPMIGLQKQITPVTAMPANGTGTDGDVYILVES